jgi:hypothetical protein
VKEPPAATARATKAATVQVRDRRTLRTAFTSFLPHLTLPPPGKQPPCARGKGCGSLGEKGGEPGANAFASKEFRGAPAPLNPTHEPHYS